MPYLQHLPHLLLVLVVLLEFVLDRPERWTLLLVLVQAFLHYPLKKRYAFFLILELMVFVVTHQPYYLIFRQTLVWYFLCQDLPNNDPETIHISLFINLILPSDNLRSHPLIGPNSFMLLLFFILAGKSKITQFDHIPLIPYQHIRTLKIPMQYFLHIVQVHHPLNNLKYNLNLLNISKLLMLLMQLIKQTTILHILRHQNKFVSCYAYTHVQHDIWMLQVRYYHQLFHEVLFVLVPFCLQVVLYRYLLTYVLTPEHLTVPAFTYQLQLLYILLFYKEL